MELRQLRCFVVVSEERHLGRAAARLYLTPQAVSKTLAALEHEVGTALAVRHRRGVELTEVGLLFAGRARTLVDDADQTLAAVRARADRRTGRLRVGVLEHSFSELTTPVLTAFRAAHPDVAVHVRSVDFLQHATALLEGEVDVILARPPVFDPRIHVDPVFVEPVVVALSIDHPLAAAPSVRIADLLDERCLRYGHGWLDERWNGHWRLDAHRNGEPARTVDHDPTTLQEVHELVALGEFVTTTPASTARHRPHPRVAFVPVTDAPGSEAAVATRAGHRDQLAEAFTKIAHRVSADNIALVPGAALAPDRASAA